MNQRHSQTWSRFVTLLLALYWIALAAGTHAPRLPTVSTPYGDKFAHYVAYAGLAFLLSWAWTTRRAFFPRGILFAFGVASVYGAIDELTQIPIPGRYGEWYDLMADTVGAATGIGLFWCLEIVYRRVLGREA